MENKNEYPKEDDVCPHCNEALLKIIKEVFPYTIDHLQCPKCDSTYIL